MSEGQNEEVAHAAIALWKGPVLGGVALDDSSLGAASDHARGTSERPGISDAEAMPAFDDARRL